MSARSSVGASFDGHSDHRHSNSDTGLVHVRVKVLNMDEREQHGARKPLSYIGKVK